MPVFTERPPILIGFNFVSSHNLVVNKVRNKIFRDLLNLVIFIYSFTMSKRPDSHSFFGHRFQQLSGQTMPFAGEFQN